MLRSHYEKELKILHLRFQLQTLYSTDNKLSNHSTLFHQLLTEVIVWVKKSEARTKVIKRTCHPFP